jgi:hypothetical protein
LVEALSSERIEIGEFFPERLARRERGATIPFA